MTGRTRHSATTSFTVVVAGAGLAGLLAWVLAPAMFPAALIGGGLLSGALRVAWVLYRSGGGSGQG